MEPASATVESFVDRTLELERYSPDDVFAPDRRDLERLVEALETHRPFTVLEFGCGYSTVVMAAKLRDLRARWHSVEDRPAVRNTKLFELFSVDASAHWQASLRRRFPASCYDNVTFLVSPCRASLWNGRLCHLYDILPDIVPDFVYLDGPDPADVEGAVHGMTFQGCPERTVMAADLLLMEPTLLPGCRILVDGRTNNARFLHRSFTRNWRMEHDVAGDVTWLHLEEPPLGPLAVAGCDVEWPPPR